MAIHRALEKAFSDDRLRIFFSIVIAFVLAAAVTIDQQSKNLIKLLVIAGLIATIFNWREIKRHAAEFHTGTVIACCFYLLSILLSIALNPINPDTLHDLRIMSIGFTALFIWSLMVSIRFRADYFWWGILLCAILSGTYALGETAIHGIAHRAVGSSNKWVLFGDISLISGLLALTARNHFRQYSIPWRWLPYIAAVMGLIASLLSGTRGGWIYLPLAFVIFFLHHIKQRQLRSLLQPKYLAPVISLLCLSGFGVFNYTQVPARISNAYHEIHQYMSARTEASGRTSIGQRFEMWRAATIASQEEPFFGVGPGGFKQQLAVLSEKNIINKLVSEAIPGNHGHTPHSHAHNEYFNTLATRGLVGLLSLLAIFLLPLMHFYPAARDQHPTRKAYGLAGILLVSGYMVFALSESVLYHEITANFFFLTLVSLLFLSSSRQTDAVAALDAHD